MNKELSLLGLASKAGKLAVGDEAVSDVIRHGENGFLVPADNPDAIVRIIANGLTSPSSVSAAAECGYWDARKLTWGKNAETYLSLFKVLTNMN